MLDLVNWLLNHLVLGPIGRLTIEIGLPALVIATYHLLIPEQGSKQQSEIQSLPKGFVPMIGGVLATVVLLILGVGWSIPSLPNHTILPVQTPTDIPTELGSVVKVARVPPMPTATSTSTLTPTPTATLTVTPSPTLTFTPFPTPTLTPTATRVPCNDDYTLIIPPQVSGWQAHIEGFVNLGIQTRYVRYEIHYYPGSPSKPPDQWPIIKDSTGKEQISFVSRKEVIADWDTTKYPNGFYTLALLVWDGNGNFGTPCLATTWINNP